MASVPQRVVNTLAHWRTSHRALPLPWRMIKRAAAAYRQNWWQYVKVLLVVLVPSAILTTYVVAPNSDSSLSAYITIANSLMNAALVLTIVKAAEKKALTVKKAYYEGSALLVRLFLLTALIGLMLAPLFIGLIIFSVGFAESAELLSVFEKVMLAILAIIFTIPSLTMLTRAMFSLYVVAETSKGPWEAIKQSRKAVRGRALAVFGRLAALVLTLTVIVVIPSVGLVMLSNALSSAWPSLILQILVGLIVLPFSNIYLYRLYQDLK